MPELADFQDAFAAALRRGGTPQGYGDPARLEAGMSVYRNTTFKGALDALRANYPTVERLVGSEWFTASAHAYLDIGWPSNPSLVTFGEHYPDFLAFFEPARPLAYLPGVARLDRSWTEAHVAPDAPVLEAPMLAGLGQDALFALTLRLHPSVRLAWFAEPAPTIWRLNRPPAPEPGEVTVERRAEGAVIARPYGQVEALVLDEGAFAFIDACRRGETLGQAVTAALAAAPEADLTQQVAELIGFGLFQPLP
jgi:hypothetical protein